MIFELSAIDLVGEPLLVSTVEQFLGLWNVGLTFQGPKNCSTVLTKRGSPTKSIALSSKITTMFSKNLHKSLYQRFN